MGRFIEVHVRLSKKDGERLDDIEMGYRGGEDEPRFGRTATIRNLIREKAARIERSRRRPERIV